MLLQDADAVEFVAFEQRRTVVTAFRPGLAWLGSTKGVTLAGRGSGRSSSNRGLGSWHVSKPVRLSRCSVRSNRIALTRELSKGQSYGISRRSPSLEALSVPFKKA
jgi:hypothetical protein